MQKPTRDGTGVLEAESARKDMVNLRPERMDAPVARLLLEEVEAEYVRLYGGEPDPPRDGEQFMPPRGLFLVARLAGQPVGCGGVRGIDGEIAELKRMYVRPETRRRGVAQTVLLALEAHAGAAGVRTLRLETGVGQPEAMALYERAGYRRIPTYGEYVDDPCSVCYAKDLSSTLA